MQLFPMGLLLVDLNCTRQKIILILYFLTLYLDMLIKYNGVLTVKNV